MRLGGIELRGVDAENWREAVRVEPREGQKRFVASVAYYLNLRHYGGEWSPLELYTDGGIVGFAIWGFDGSEGSHWIGGLIVAAEQQGKGYGRAAMETLPDFLATQPGYRGAALSYEPENTVARRLYASLGFVETGERMGDELIARRPADGSTTTQGG